MRSHDIVADKNVDNWGCTLARKHNHFLAFKESPTALTQFETLSTSACRDSTSKCVAIGLYRTMSSAYNIRVESRDREMLARAYIVMPLSYSVATHSEFGYSLHHIG